MERHMNPVWSDVAPETSATDQGIVMPPMLAITRIKPVVDPVLRPASLAARAIIVGTRLAKKKPAQTNIVIAATPAGIAAARRIRAAAVAAVISMVK